MEQSIAAYVDRILGLVDKEPLEILASTPGALAGIVNSVPAERLLQKLSPGEWSPAEVLAHLADSELVSAFRVRKMVSEPGSEIPAYDQDAWSRGMDYASRAPAESLQTFTL